MTNIAVILSGCGHLDGAEIRESVLALTALDKAGAKVSIFAPDAEQHHVVNHLTGEETGESRNIIIEAARIARGKIAPLSELNVADFDALVMPGGFGAAKNFSDLAFKGGDCTINPAVKTIITGFFSAGKPIGAICIAPAIVVAALKGKATPTVTIGDDEDGLIKALGGTHQSCKTEQCVIDKEHKIVTTSAYMQDDARVYDVFLGIDRLVQAVMNLTK